MSSDDVPSGTVVDNDYKSRTGQSQIPVQSDDAAIESTEYDNGGDSDKQLGKLLINHCMFIANSFRTRREGCH